MASTKIEWAEKVWNPVTGCTKISPGCANCYAERMSKRLAGRCGYLACDPFKVTMHPDRLDQPLHWKKPQRIFTCSMGDLFHDDVPDWAIDEVFGVILACNILTNVPRHTFMGLTKRAERMQRYFTERNPAELLQAWADVSNWITVGDGDTCFDEYVYSACCHDWDESGTNSSGSEYKPWGYTDKLFPLPNVWLGVTVENQEQADLRIPLLLETPAALRYVSGEPMLSALDIRQYLAHDPRLFSERNGYRNYLNWVISGGESGPGARPLHPEWVRALRDQCILAATPFMFKQWGEWVTEKQSPPNIVLPSRSYFPEDWDPFDFTEVYKVGKQKAGRLLDGQLWDQYPEVQP